MFREKYAQKRALQLFTLERGEEVAAMLLEEGASSEQLATLVTKYQKMHKLLLTEDSKRKVKTARMQATIGGVLLACGIFLTVGSYLYLDSGSYLVYYGLISVGLVLLTKGSIDKKAALEQYRKLQTI